MSSEVEINVTGQVQGVFFRAQVQEIANRLSITGYAKNLTDGSVEIIAQGDNDSLEKMIAEIKNSPGGSQVEQVKSHFRKPSKQYDCFDVI